MKLSLLLTTIGRHTLTRTMQSLARQAWEPGDEVVVVSDTNHAQVQAICKDFAVPGRSIVMPNGPYKDWGHTPRNMTMTMMRGDYIMHFDDDDVATPSMVKDIHTQLTDKTTMHMFRMLSYNTGQLVWKIRGLLRRRFISTQNIVHPNKPKTFGVWGNYYGGDAQFIMQTAAKIKKIAWHDTITCIYGPDSSLTLAQVYAWATPRGVPVA